MSVKGASYFNIFECGRNLLYQLDVTYQRSFTASKETSSVPKGIYQISPEQERYYDMMAGHIKEKNVVMDKDEIHKAISHVKSEDKDEHERNIQNMIQYDDYKSPCKIKDATVATGLKTVMYSSDLDEKPAARKEPITDTQTLKEPIRVSHLGKIVCHSEDEPNDMDPIVTGFGIIGQVGYWAISQGSHTQRIIQGGENIICSDVITHILTNSGELALESGSFPFNPLKAETLMVPSLDEPFL